MSHALLELRQITVSFDGFLALRDLNLSLQPGAVSYTHLTLPTTPYV